MNGNFVLNIILATHKNTAIRGRYKPSNPEKYNGNIKKITYRSMWERRFMLYCDRSPKITEWSSEELHIPYVSPKDNRWHNYYPDFVIKTNTGRSIIIEIKPYFQRTYAVNKAKWKAANEYGKEKNMEFKILTERELF